MKDNLSDFMKTAYKHNRVKDLNDAFKDYPVEYEWHKGKVENIIKEGTVKYDTYNIGDIVFVGVYLYPDGKVGNNHLFVIIDQDNTAIPIEYFGMLLSSCIDKIRFNSNKLIKKDNKNNLNRDSIVKTDIVYKLYDKQILFKIGSINKDQIEEYKKSFYDSLKENKNSD